MSKVQVNKIQSFTGHKDCVYTLATADQPHLFFSGAGDGMIVLWDLKNSGDGNLIAKLPNSVYALHHLSDQDILVAGQNYSGIHLFDYKNKKEISSLQLSPSAIFDMQSLGNHLYLASGDGSITDVDLEKWRINKKIIASEKSARAIAINKLSGEIAVGYSDHFIRIFALDDLHLKFEFKAHENSVFTLCYSPDQKYLFSGGRDARLKIWDTQASYQQAEEIVAHMYAINNLALSPNGKNFATCSMDKSIKIWDTENLSLLKVIDKGRHSGHGTSVNKLLWTSFNNQLVSASDDRSISAWDLLFL